MTTAQAQSGPSVVTNFDVEYRHLPDLIAQTCQRFANQTAFTSVLPNGIFGKLSFAQVQQYSDAFAVFLREELKLNAGDRVALQMPNSLTYPLCAFGVLKAGCVLVNTNPLYTPSEMTHQFRDSGAKALIIIDIFADKLEPTLPKTDIQHVIMVKLTDLFPALPGFIAYNVMKYWNRIIPKTTVTNTPFSTALERGMATQQAKQITVANYTASLSTNDLAVLQYTGGTTGVSKGAMLSHGNLLANVVQIKERVAEEIRYGEEYALAVLPLYHIFAFTANLLFFFSLGSVNVLVANPRPLSNVQRAIENYPISWIPGVNTLFNGLLNEDWFADYPPPKLRGSIAGGTALLSSVANRWTRITGTPVIEGYGLTETSPVVTLNPIKGQGGNRTGTIGFPVKGTEVRLLDSTGAEVTDEPGELVVRGPQVMLGYWQRADETAKSLVDGWLQTGDIAVRETDGYYKIVDRRKDLILVSGFNVYPNEVEDCIALLDGVAEVAVIGLPDGVAGELVRAYVVPQAGVTLTAEAVREHCRKSLTGYKVPRQVEFRSDLPKSNVGKVLRRELRDEVLNAKGGA